MPSQIISVKKSDGVPREQISSMLSSGWRCIPSVSIKIPEDHILVPGKVKKEARIEIVDIWYQPPPPRDVVPVSYIAEVIHRICNDDDHPIDTVGLDLLVRNMFDVTLEKLLANVGKVYDQQSDPAPDPEAGERPNVVPGPGSSGRKPGDNSR